MELSKSKDMKCYLLLLLIFIQYSVHAQSKAGSTFNGPVQIGDNNRQYSFYVDTTSALSDYNNYTHETIKHADHELFGHLVSPKAGTWIEPMIIIPKSELSNVPAGVSPAFLYRQKNLSNIYHGNRTFKFDNGEIDCYYIKWANLVNKDRGIFVLKNITIFLFGDSSNPNKLYVYDNGKIYHAGAK